MKKIIERLQSPTPKFFAWMRNISLILAAVATTVVAAPIALPAIVIQIAGYVALAGAVAGAISQTAVEGE